jgi:hypothetical protein
VGRDAWDDYCSPPKVDAVQQNLIRSILFFRQPFKGSVGKRAGNEGIHDLLQREHEETARGAPNSVAPY